MTLDELQMKINSLLQYRPYAEPMPFLWLHPDTFREVVQSINIYVLNRPTLVLLGYPVLLDDTMARHEVRLQGQGLTNTYWVPDVSPTRQEKHLPRTWLPTVPHPLIDPPAPPPIRLIDLE